MKLWRRIWLPRWYQGEFGRHVRRHGLFAPLSFCWLCWGTVGLMFASYQLLSVPFALAGVLISVAAVAYLMRGWMLSRPFIDLLNCGHSGRLGVALDRWIEQEKTLHDQSIWPCCQFLADLPIETSVDIKDDGSCQMLICGLWGIPVADREKAKPVVAWLINLERSKMAAIARLASQLVDNGAKITHKGDEGLIVVSWPDGQSWCASAITMLESWKRVIPLREEWLAKHKMTPEELKADAEAFMAEALAESSTIWKGNPTQTSLSRAEPTEEVPDTALSRRLVDSDEKPLSESA